MYQGEHNNLDQDSRFDIISGGGRLTNQMNLFNSKGTNQRDRFYSEWNKSNEPYFSREEQIKGTFFIPNGTNQMDPFLVQRNKSNGPFFLEGN